MRLLVTRGTSSDHVQVIPWDRQPKQSAHCHQCWDCLWWAEVLESPWGFGANVSPELINPNWFFRVPPRCDNLLSTAQFFLNLCLTLQFNSREHSCWCRLRVVDSQRSKISKASMLDVRSVGQSSRKCNLLCNGAFGQADDDRSVGPLMSSLILLGSNLPATPFFHLFSSSPIVSANVMSQTYLVVRRELGSYGHWYSKSRMGSQGAAKSSEAIW